jgi:hypothetical protein
MDEIKSLIDLYPTIGPWVIKISLVVGIARLVLKPLSRWIKGFLDWLFVKVRGDSEKEHVLDTVLNSIWWVIFAYLVDYLTSVKLPTDYPETTTEPQTPPKQ